MEEKIGESGIFRVPEGSKDFIEDQCSVCGESRKWVKPKNDVDGRYCSKECWELRIGKCVNCNYTGAVEEWDKSYLPNGETKGRICPDCGDVGHMLVEESENSKKVDGKSTEEEE